MVGFGLRPLGSSHLTLAELRLDSEIQHACGLEIMSIDPGQFDRLDACSVLVKECDVPPWTADSEIANDARTSHPGERNGVRPTDFLYSCGSSDIQKADTASYLAPGARGADSDRVG